MLGGRGDERDGGPEAPGGGSRAAARRLRHAGCGDHDEKFARGMVGGLGAIYVLAGALAVLVPAARVCRRWPSWWSLPPSLVSFPRKIRMERRAAGRDAGPLPNLYRKLTEHW